MKRRDLTRQLRDAASAAGLEFTSLRIPIPNHREIAEGTARSILQQAAAKLGEEWWT